MREREDMRRHQREEEMRRREKEEQYWRMREEQVAIRGSEYGSGL